MTTFTTEDRESMEKSLANKPVAWRTHYPSGWEYKDGNPPFELKGNSELLYNTPQIEQLSDERILELWAENIYITDFARAILKEANIL